MGVRFGPPQKFVQPEMEYWVPSYLFGNMVLNEGYCVLQ